ncbi:cilia- and flagella-associated protein 157 [Phlebotomus argentipes]|uniref:cilia- and flagella-associated protein 157 n=1 Tax=Phlebotomus argentipes TaxID=94469 RepID=UPI0028932F4B|nr:cilia- and flagella-associated protein 157 [Phlebotomus argentipes]
MAGKKKKEKKKKPPKEKKEGDTLPSLDKQFYELTIQDLNNKLARLRTHNAKVEEQIEDLEAKMKQLQEDKSDITAYLNRTLLEKVDVIRELEEKLIELNNVREEEGREAQNRLKEWDSKYKAMYDQLTSEIKLLTGKLNSLEEFRIQRDEILAKFDAQEAQLRDQQRRHEDKLYEMERNNVIGKDRLKKEVESRLLQLSNEFTKSTHLRVAAHTQRLVRENIALTNELDKILVTHERLQEEKRKMLATLTELKSQARVNAVEKARLVRSTQEQIEVIDRMAGQYENLQRSHEVLMGKARTHDKAVGREKAIERELSEAHRRIEHLEHTLQIINSNREDLRAASVRFKTESQHVMSVLKALQSSVRKALLDGQQRNILHEIMNILTGLNAISITDSAEAVSMVNSIYNHGDLGFLFSTDDTPCRQIEQTRVDVAEEEPQPPEPVPTTGAFDVNVDKGVSKRYSSGAIIDVGSAAFSEQFSRDDADDSGETKDSEDDTPADRPSDALSKLSVEQGE